MIVFHYYSIYNTLVIPKEKDNTNGKAAIDSLLVKKFAIKWMKWMNESKNWQSNCQTSVGTYKKLPIWKFNIKKNLTTFLVYG